MQAYNILTFNLARKYSIRVSVIDSSSGDPVKDARIYLDDQAQNKTSEDGTLTLSGVAEGTHVIEASLSGVSARRSILVAKDDQAFELSLKTQKNNTLKVVEKLSGDPVSGALVSLDGESVGLTAADGTLLLDSSYSGEHVVEISYLDVSTSRSIDLSDVKDVFTIKIDISQSITLEIKDSETEKSVSGWDVILENSRLTRIGARTGLDGKTEVMGVIPGSYDISLHSSAPGINASYSGELVIPAGINPLSVNIDMPDPRYSGVIDCGEYGVFEMGRCNVSVRNVEYERGMPSYDADVFLFVFTGSNRSGAGGFELAGQHLKHIPALSQGEVYSAYFDSLTEFEGNKKEIIVALILEGWDYSPQNERSAGRDDVSATELSDLVRKIKEHCADESAICPQVLEKKIVGALAYAN